MQVHRWYRLQCANRIIRRETDKYESTFFLSLNPKKWASWMPSVSLSLLQDWYLAAGLICSHIFLPFYRLYTTTYLSLPSSNLIVDTHMVAYNRSYRRSKTKYVTVQHLVFVSTVTPNSPIQCTSIVSVIDVHGIKPITLYQLIQTLLWSTGLGAHN